MFTSLNIVGARTDQCYSNIYAYFYRATNIPQRKFSNVEILPLKPSKDERIAFVKDSGTVWLETSFSKKINKINQNVFYLFMLNYLI